MVRPFFITEMLSTQLSVLTNKKYTSITIKTNGRCYYFAIYRVVIYTIYGTFSKSKEGSPHNFNKELKFILKYCEYIVIICFFYLRNLEIIKIFTINSVCGATVFGDFLSIRAHG